MRRISVYWALYIYMVYIYIYCGALIGGSYCVHTYIYIYVRVCIYIYIELYSVFMCIYIYVLVSPSLAPRITGHPCRDLQATIATLRFM